MSVISISITESELQVISGIPKTLTLSTNIPATIFYTVDGTDPTTSSLVYIDTISLPTHLPTVTFKAFATDGVNTCPLIEQVYRPNISGLRQSHDEVFGGFSTKKESTIGYNGPTIPLRFGTFGPKSLIVDKPSVENIFDGYGAYGTDLPLSEYDLIFSETNSIGKKGRGIGTLPSNTTVIGPELNTPDIISDTSSPFFNPRARVIVQDSRNPPFDDGVQHINRTFFSLENSEVVRDGALLNTTGLEGLVPTGSLVRSFFNPRANTITYYYFDSATLRWIISTEPFTPKSQREVGLANVVFSSRTPGDSKVFRWRPFGGRHLT